MNLLSEDWFSVSATIALLVSILPLLKFMLLLISSHKQFKVKNLELLFQAIEKDTNIATKLVVEQQFFSIFKYDISYEEICILLSSYNPTNAIRLHKDCLRYLEVENKHFKLKSQFSNDNSRLKEYFLAPLKKFGWYMVFAFPTALLSVVLVFIAPKTKLLELSFGLPNAAWYLLVAGAAGFFGRLAYNKITDTQSIKYAEELLLTYNQNYIKCVELGFWQNLKRMLINCFLVISRFSQSLRNM